MLDFISRADAKAKGLRMFFTGAVCRHGHIAERYTSTGQCQACLSESNQRRYNKDPQAVVKRSAAWRKKNPEAYTLSSKRHYYKKFYGLSLEDLELMRQSQNNQCLGCTRPLGDRPHVDHSHRTGAIRGLLCGPCNQTLGLVKEDVETLARLAAYLSKHQ